MPLTAAMPPKDFVQPASRIAPPVTGRSTHCGGEPGEVACEPVDVVRRRAGRTTTTAPPFPTAAGTRRRCAGRASARGRAGRRCRGSRGIRAPRRLRKVTQPFAPTLTTCHGESDARRSLPSTPARMRAASRSRCAYAVIGQHALERRPRRRHRERVAVERADLLVACRRRSLPSPAWCRRSRRPRCRRRAPSPGTRCPGRRRTRRSAAGTGGESGLDLVEGEQRIVAVQQFAQPGEVAASGAMMPAFIMIGSRIMPATRPALLDEHTLDGLEIVERHDHDEVADRRRDAGAARRPRSGARADRSRRPRAVTDTCTESWWPW